MEAGYITLSRRFFANFLWAEDREYSRAEAWLDLIRMATFRDETVLIQGRCLNLRAGELAASIRYLNDRWGWSKSKVERFLQMLEQNRMIETRSETGITVVTLCNYARYNTGRDIDRDINEDTNGTVARQPRDKSNNSKNRKNPKPSPAEGEKDLFGEEKSKPTDWQPTDEQIEVAAWFNRRSATVWSEKELAAWKKIKQPMDPDDWDALKWFYTESDCPYLRRDLQTLLNNWNGEIDRPKTTTRRRSDEAPGHSPISQEMIAPPANPYGRKRHEVPTFGELIELIQTEQTPHSEEAERAIISSWMHNPDLLDEDAVQLAAFHNEANRTVAGEMMSLKLLGKLMFADGHFDIPLFTHHLRARCVLDRAGGPVALIEYYQYPPLPSHYAHYRRILTDCFQRRQLLQVLALAIHQLQTLGRTDEHTLSTCVEQLQRNITDVEADDDSADIPCRPIEQIINTVVEKAEYRANNPGVLQASPLESRAWTN